MTKVATPRRERATPRKLVRWDQEIDMMCFLAIPKIMARRNIKFPWGEVAAYVGSHVTGNALLQHMAKMSRKRAGMGQLIPEDKESTVGPASDYPLMAASGFGDRKIAVPAGAQDPIDDGKEESPAPVLTPKRKRGKPETRTHVAIPTGKVRRQGKAAVAVKAEQNSDDDVSISPARTVRSRPAKKAAQRAFSTAIISSSDIEYRPGSDVESVFEQSPKRAKRDNCSASSYSASETGGLGKPHAISFVNRRHEFADMVAAWTPNGEAVMRGNQGTLNNDLDSPNLSLAIAPHNHADHADHAPVSRVYDQFSQSQSYTNSHGTEHGQEDADNNLSRFDVDDFSTPFLGDANSEEHTHHAFHDRHLPSNEFGIFTDPIPVANSRIKQEVQADTTFMLEFDTDFVNNHVNGYSDTDFVHINRRDLPGLHE